MKYERKHLARLIPWPEAAKVVTAQRIKRSACRQKIADSAGTPVETLVQMESGIAPDRQDAEKLCAALGLRLIVRSGQWFVEQPLSLREMEEGCITSMAHFGRQHCALFADSCSTITFNQQEYELVKPFLQELSLEK